MLSVLVLLGIADEVEAGLVRQLSVLGAAHQCLLDGIRDTCHYAKTKRAILNASKLDKGPKLKVHRTHWGKGGRQLESGEWGHPGLSQKKE